MSGNLKKRNPDQKNPARRGEANPSPRKGKAIPLKAPRQAGAEQPSPTQKKHPVQKKTRPAGASVQKVAASGLHPRNLHRGRYDFKSLVQSLPALKPYVIKNPAGEASINFSDALAVKMLNKALLAHFYGIREWDIPSGYLCPPIPGRADYIHRAAELLTKTCPSVRQDQVKALDIGIGANAIYPIIGVTQYGWHCIGSDIDPVSLSNVENIVAGNPVLQPRIECRLQNSSRSVFKGIIREGEKIDITTCNPPFHSSAQEAAQGTQRKLNNLSANRAKKRGTALRTQADKTPALNFGGQKNELWCQGGEAAFIRNMAQESKAYAGQVLWFTTLISKSDNVRWMKKQLEKVGAETIQVHEMRQGQKVSRFIAWSFHNSDQRKLWLENKC